MDAPIGTEIRTADDPDLRRRRKIAGLAGFAAADFLLGALFQTGVIGPLPDPPIPGVDSRAVMASRAGYPFGIPDTPLALALSGVTMALAVAGGARRPAIVDTALRVVTTGGAIAAVGYLAQMARIGRVCVYCIAGASALIAMVPLARRRTEARACR